MSLPEKPKSRIYKWRFLLFPIIFLTVILNSCYHSYRGHIGSYDFVITKTDTLITGHLRFYSGNKQVSILNYNDYKSVGILPGDSIHKGARKKMLLIFRKAGGKYELFKTLNPQKELSNMFWKYEE